MNFEGAQTEMPRYICHKKVWALKIAEINADESGAMVTPEEGGYAPFHVEAAYLAKHSPKVGGYYVVYEDGYKSYSPAQAFETGYTRV